MATTRLDDYVATAASNTAIGNVGIDNDQLNPSDLDNTFRELTAQIARYIKDVNASRSLAGGTTAYTYASYGSTASKPFTAYYSGLQLLALANATNTGTSTLNVDSLGAKAIRKYAAGSEAAIAAGDLVANAPAHLVYNASANSGAGAFILLNPMSAATYLANVVEDTTPQLGGDLDLNGNDIVFPSATVSDVLDEDNMASNSATKLATQQSIKAYVDSAVSAGSAVALTDIGSFILGETVAATYTAGDTATGASLDYSNAGGTVSGSPGTGTWRCHGYSLSGSGGFKTTLWQRIS